MTTRRDEIVAFIAEYAVEHHNAPSVRDIAEQFSISIYAAYKHMLHLVDEGRLIIIDGQWKLANAEYIPPPDSR